MVIINWSGSSFRFTLWNSWIIHHCDSLNFSILLSSSNLGNKLERLGTCKSWALPTGRAKWLVCTEEFLQWWQNIVQTGFPLCQHVQRAGGRSIFACT